MVKVLFVCMGNICRSPTAQGVFQQLVNDSGLKDKIQVDSAGTHAYHVGETPDSRAMQAALKRQIDLSYQKARKVSVNDFSEFDYILAMDNENYSNLQYICPVESRPKIFLFLEFSESGKKRDVPDPYYGGGRGFEKVLDLVTDASYGLLEHIRDHDL